MKISKQGIDFIKKHESLRLEPYYDVAGLLTIGYGHLIKPSEYFDKISEQEAELILKNDLAVSEQAVNQYAVQYAKLDQNQYDALVSLVFNIGTGNFKSSTVLERIVSGRTKEEIVEAWKWWNKATINGQKQVVQGLLNRREEETQFYLSFPKKKDDSSNTIISCNCGRSIKIEIE